MSTGLQALFDLEATNQDLKPYLRDLYITSAQEIDTVAARKAIVIHVRARPCLQAAAPSCIPAVQLI